MLPERCTRPFIAMFTLAAVLVTAATPALAQDLDETQWEKGTRIAGYASDILTAAQIDDDLLSAAGEVLGHGLLGIAIGDAWSAIENGDVEGGLSTLGQTVGETAIGLTTAGPAYALGKLLSQATVALVESQLNWAVDLRYQEYKALRSQGILKDVESRRLSDFVAWAKSGRAVFDTYSNSWLHDGAARIVYINAMQEERRSRHSLADRVGYQLWPFGEGARQYQAEMAHVPKDAEIQDYIFSQWEGRLVTEVLQAVARIKREHARAAAQRTRLFIRVTVKEPSGTPVPPDQLAIVDGSGTALLTPALSFQTEGLLSNGQTGFLAPLNVVSAVSGQEPLRLVWRLAGQDVPLQTFTMDDLLRQKGQALKHHDLTYLTRDWGALVANRPGTTLTVRSTEPTVADLALEAIDPLLNIISQSLDTATGLLTAQVDGPAGRPLLAAVKGTDRSAGVRRTRSVPVSLTGQPGGISLTVPMAAAEARPAAATLDAVLAALAANQEALLQNRFSWSEYLAAQERLVSEHAGLKDATGASAGPQLRDRADALERHLRDLALSEAQALRANVQSFQSQVDRLQAQTDREIENAVDPADYLQDSDWLYPLKRRLELFDTYAARYGLFLDQRLADLAKLTSLRAEFSQATASARQQWALLQADDTVSGADAALQRAFRSLEDRLRPYATRARTGYVNALRAHKGVLESRRDGKLRAATAALGRVQALRTELAGRRIRLDSLLTQIEAWKARGLMADLEQAQAALVFLQRAPDDFSDYRVREANAALDRVNGLLAKPVTRTDEAQSESSVPGLLQRLQPWLNFATEFEAARDSSVADQALDAGRSDRDLVDLFNALAGAADYGDGPDFPLQTGLRERVEAYVRPLHGEAEAFAARKDLAQGWPRSGAVGMESGESLRAAVAAILGQLEKLKADPAAQAYVAHFEDLAQAGQGLSARMSAAAMARMNGSLTALTRLHNQLHVVDWQAAFATPALDRLVDQYATELWTRTLPAWVDAQIQAWAELNPELAQLDDSRTPYWDLTPAEQRHQLNLWAGRLEVLRQAAQHLSWFSSSNLPPYQALVRKHQAGLQPVLDRLEAISRTGETQWRNHVGDLVNKPVPVFTGSTLQFQLRSRAAVLNGQPVALDVEPPVRGGRTMVPLRQLGEAMGALVTWEASKRKVTYRLGSAQVELWVDRKTARVSGQEVPIDPAPEIISGRTYVPLRFVSEALGATVNYDAATGGITIEHGR